MKCDCGALKVKDGFHASWCGCQLGPATKTGGLSEVYTICTKAVFLKENFDYKYDFEYGRPEVSVYSSYEKQNRLNEGQRFRVPASGGYLLVFNDKVLLEIKRIS